MSKKSVAVKKFEPVFETLFAIQNKNRAVSDVEIIKSLRNFYDSYTAIYPYKDTQKLTAGVKDAQGKDQEINLIEEPLFIVANLINHLKIKSSGSWLAEIISQSNSIIEQNKYPLALRFNILNIESLIEEVLKVNIFEIIPSLQLRKALTARINLPQSLLKQNEINPDSSELPNLDKIIGSYQLILSKIVESFQKEGNFLQCVTELYSLIKSAKSKQEIKILVHAYINFCSCLALVSKDDLGDLISEYCELFEKEEFELLLSLIETNSMMHIESLGMSFEKIEVDDIKNKRLYTEIRFSMPQAMISKSNASGYLEKGIHFSLSPITSFVEDPFYQAFRTFSFGGMSWLMFCDTDLNEQGNFTHFVIKCDEFFDPDIEIINREIHKKSFELETSKRGRTYYPIKEYIIDKLYEHHSKLSVALDIDRKDITIDVFSNYMVQHRDKISNEVKQSKLQALTNPNSSRVSINKYLDQLSKVSLADQYKNIRTIFENCNINTSVGFNLLILQLLEVTCKRDVEHHACYKYLWLNEGKNLVPRKEVDIQPLIKLTVRSICDFSGIQISREVVTANGSVDFLFSYNTPEHKLLKSCVELKLAHNQNLDRGLTHQLPEYMKSEGTREGVFLVAWFKGDSFSKPTKYNNSNDLLNHLNNINQNPRIKIIIIDCSKPISPSKLK